MGKRLATEYVKACFALTGTELRRFVQFFAERQVMLQTKVLDHGNHEFVFQDEASGDALQLSIVRQSKRYMVTGSCRLTTPALVDTMKRAVSDFKGDATVNRVYTGYMIAYEYRQGAVSKIEEVRGKRRNLIYAYKDRDASMSQLFRSTEVEERIQAVRKEIDAYLDRRNGTRDSKHILEIDGKLSELARQLFLLEP